MAGSIEMAFGVWRAVGPDPPQGKGMFGGFQTWACPVGLHWGMDLWTMMRRFIELLRSLVSYHLHCCVYKM